MYISLTIFLFKSGIAFYFHLLSTVQVTVRPKKKICVFTVTFKKNLGSVGIHFFFTIGKTGNSCSRFRNFIFEISGKPSFVEAVLWRITQFFYLLCSQFRQKASGWINKTLLLIKQYITYMNISRYANMDKFVNIRHIFLLARRAYSWLFQLAQMWKLLAPGVGIVDFLTPVLVGSQRVITSAQGVIVVGFTSINTISVLPHNYKILLQVQLVTHSDIYKLYTSCRFDWRIIIF